MINRRSHLLACFCGRSPRLGVTLVEMMVALAVTLIMMGAVISVFGRIGRNVTDSRSTVEMSERLRAAAQRLRFELAGVIPQTIPPQRPEANAGYLEIFEGPNKDSDSLLGQNSRLGDRDDILVMTVRSIGDPFVGRVGASGSATTVESPIAEVAWFCAEVPGQGATVPPVPPEERIFALYRRTFLVTPGPDFPGVHRRRWKRSSFP